ncbi:sensor histidine kinase [Roseivivax sp.]
MTSCLSGLNVDLVFLGVALVWVVALVMLVWMAAFQRFEGKRYFIVTNVNMLWWLAMVGLEAATPGAACKLAFSTLSWPAIAMLPLAWCMFVFAYVDDAAWVHRRSVHLGVALFSALVGVVALTNPWHGLLYGPGTAMAPGAGRISYVHGPFFYAVVAAVYPFVMAALICLGRAFTRAERHVWPLLATLVLITIAPLSANAAYVFWDVTFFGLDPTSFMFTFGVVAFSSILAKSKTMDMATIGRQILFDATTEPVVVVDRRHRVVLRNAAARRVLFGHGAAPGEAVLPRGVARFLGDLGRAEREAEPQIVVGERIYEPRVSEVSDPLNPTRRKLGWSVTLVDITERIKTTEALELALRQAAEANRAKDEFISVISHELRTPLTSLKGGLALVQSGRLGELTQPMQSSLDIARRNGERLSRLIDNILLAQKIELEALVLDRTPVDLAALLEGSIGENQMFAEERKVRLEARQGGPAPVILGDEFRLRQVVDNLISNAIKFSSPGAVVEGFLGLEGGRARLSIKDSGRGIPEGAEDRVFGRFAQVDGTKTRSAEGSGLGLHISKQLVEQMSGVIFYDSTVGQGTVFHVEFDLLAEASPDVEMMAG